jgi:hypothetical protein
MSTDQTPAQRAMLDALPDDAWKSVWSEFRDAHREFQDRNAGWRAFWTDHHQYALDAALKALAAALDLPALIARERAAGRKQAVDAIREAAQQLPAYDRSPVAVRARLTELADSLAEGGEPRG